jgi:hypothetical protein
MGEKYVILLNYFNKVLHTSCLLHYCYLLAKAACNKNLKLTGTKLMMDSHRTYWFYCTLTKLLFPIINYSNTNCNEYIHTKEMGWGNESG